MFSPALQSLSVAPAHDRPASFFALSQEIESHPIESLTFHGFNPVTSHKTEWTGTLPQFLSALQSKNLHSVTFLDVPSLRNKRRHILNWDNVDHLQSVTTLQISLATTVDEGEAAAEAEDHDEDFETDEVDEKGEMTLRVSRRLFSLFGSATRLGPRSQRSAALRFLLNPDLGLFIATDHAGRDQIPPHGLPEPPQPPPRKFPSLQTPPKARRGVERLGR